MRTLGGLCYWPARRESVVFMPFSLNRYPASEGAYRMGKVTPFLWFDTRAEEAARFYVAIFNNAKIENISRSGDGPEDPVFSVTFELDGQRFMALTGGPQYSFTPAVSFFVSCETQAEVDDFWTKLSAGGKPGHCG